MKKVISFLLSAIMLLGMAACAPAGTGDDSDTTTTGGDTAGQLMVGFGKAQIDPTESVPLDGYGSTEKRMSTGLKSHVYNIAVAITDAQGNTGIMIAADLCTLKYEIAKEIRDGIEKECGVPADNVIISAIHQHSTTDMGNSKVLSAANYRDDIFIPGAIEAAKLAMENRAPATVQTASVETENMNFVRHYIMDDGSYAGPNFGNTSLTFVGHAAEGDQVMQLVKFVREGQTTMDGKEAKNIILVNYQGHPLIGTSGTDTNVHSDVVGVLRDELSEDLDCEVAYFSGASGNMAFSSYIKEENITSDYKDHGKKLAKLAASAEGSYTDVELASVKASKVVYTGECNHTEDHLLEKAQAAWDKFQANGDTSVFAQNGFNSRYHATAIINHAKLPESIDFELFALSFGDIAFIGAPYEMFCDTGMAIKEGSPFKMTIVSTIANGSNSYMPTVTAWDYNCYEKNQCNFVRGTAEKLGDEFIGMLKDLHSQN